MGPVGPPTAKAVGPFKIKKQITQNTFEIDIPLAIWKKMRPMFHSSEFIPFETRDLDPVGALPPRERNTLIYWMTRKQIYKQQSYRVQIMTKQWPEMVESSWRYDPPK